MNDTAAGFTLVRDFDATPQEVWSAWTRPDEAAAWMHPVVDVLRLRVVPRLLGSGRGVAPAGIALTELALTASRAHAGGHVTLQYEVTLPGG